MDPHAQQPLPETAPKNKKGRPRILDEKKQALLVGLVGHGISQRMAARMVRCTWATVRNQAKRDPAFAESLAAAEIRRLIAPLQNIIAASAKSWRAAAWLVSRFNDQQYLAQIDRLRDAVSRKDAQVDTSSLHRVLDEIDEKTVGEGGSV